MPCWGGASRALVDVLLGSRNLAGMLLPAMFQVA